MTALKGTGGPLLLNPWLGRGLHCDVQICSMRRVRVRSAGGDVHRAGWQQLRRGLRGGRGRRRGRKAQPRAAPGPHMGGHGLQGPLARGPQSAAGLPAQPAEQLVPRVGLRHWQRTLAHQPLNHRSGGGSSAPALHLSQARAR